MGTLKERIHFFRAEWRKAHWWYYAAAVMLTAAVVIAGLMLRIAPLVCGGIPTALGGYIIIYNKMMAFVEANAFDGSGHGEEVTSEDTEAPPCKDAVIGEDASEKTETASCVEDGAGN